MKKTLLIIAVMLALPLAGCRHMKEIDEKLENLDNRLTALEEKVDSMNRVLSGINALLSGRYLVNSVTELPDGSGLKVVLVDAAGNTTELSVAGGTDFSEPPISVRQDTDGNWYWTVGGNWLLAGGEKVIADGADSRIPRVRIEDGKWYVSVDGRNWTLAGAMLGGEGSMIAGVDFTSDPRNVIFTLSDGSTVTLSKSQSMIRLQILFDEDALSAIPAGMSASSEYEVVAPEGVEYVFSTYEPEGWTVSFSEPVSDKGTLTVSVPMHASDAKVLIVLNGDDGSSYVRVLEVRVLPHPILDMTVPSFIIDGSEHFYSKGSDQLVRCYDGSLLTFAILDIDDNEQIEVSGFDTSLSMGDRTTVAVSWKKGGWSLLSRSLDVTVEKSEGSLVWLLDDNGNGMIIRK